VHDLARVHAEQAKRRGPDAKPFWLDEPDGKEGAP